MEMWRLRLSNDVRHKLLLLIMLSTTLVMMTTLTTQPRSEYLSRNIRWDDSKPPPVDVNCSNFQSHDLRLWTQHVQRQRLNRVTEVCRQRRPQGNLTVAMLDHILVDDYHKILYCAIPKVACTNWKKVFVQFSPHRTKHVWNVHNSRFMQSMGLKYLNTFNKSEIFHRVKNYFKFMFVRNPLERLLSAYKDKFTVYNKYTKHFRHKYAKKIIKRYRKDNGSKDQLRFSEFIKYLVDTEEPFNPHWAHYYDLCQPCRISYDYIGKMATMPWDAQAILQRIGGSTKCHSLPSYLEQSQKTSAIMANYYANISQEDLHRLVNVYTLDFRLFDYSPLIH